MRYKLNRTKASNSDERSPVVGAPAGVLRLHDVEGVDVARVL